MKQPVIWVLIADGGRAFALTDAEHHHDFRPVPGFAFEGPHKLDRDIGTDRPARTFQGPGSASRSTTAEIGDLSRGEERRFLASVADKLVSCHGKGAFDQLVLVLPPEKLGAMRVALRETLSDHVIAEIAADLIHEPAERISRTIVDRLTA